MSDVSEPEQPSGGDDDWVKQALAEAILGRPLSTPVAEPEPVVGAEPVVEAEPEPVPAPVVEEEPLPEPVVEVEPEPEPEPVSTSRLFERPAFDATRDPDVEEMLVEERAGEREFEPEPSRSVVREVLEWVVVLASAVGVALLLRAFVFQAFFIPSESMEETLLVDDRLLVNKLSYRFGEVDRGEVVVFRRDEDQSAVNQPAEFSELIKRVIGLPGETVEARENTIFINGQVLIEPYLTPGEVISDFGPVEVPEDHYFVMGDNRDNSGDSRVFGPIERDQIIGRAFFLFWPIDRIGSL